MIGNTSVNNLVSWMILCNYKNVNYFIFDNSLLFETILWVNINELSNLFANFNKHIFFRQFSFSFTKYAIFLIKFWCIYFLPIFFSLFIILTGFLKKYIHFNDQYFTYYNLSSFLVYFLDNNWWVILVSFPCSDWIYFFFMYKCTIATLIFVLKIRGRFLYIKKFKICFWLAFTCL